MSTTSDLLRTGAETIRKQAEDNLSLRQKVASYENLKSAIRLVEVLEKAGRLQESTDPIVERAERILAEGSYEKLRKQAEKSNIHIDPSLIGDLRVEDDVAKEAGSGMVALDPENNSFHRLLVGGL
jgi:hypothetical protein